MRGTKIIAILVCMALMSCTGEIVSPVGILNQLENDGAVMPVHIHGDLNARSALIVVHGGPGESAILKRKAIGFYLLETDHVVAYYDQRGSGISQGNVANTSLTVEQMAMDLHAVVQLVEAASMLSPVVSAAKPLIVRVDSPDVSWNSTVRSESPKKLVPL